MVISELVSATGIEYAGEKTLDLLRFHEEERIVGLQIFGEDTELFAKPVNMSKTSAQISSISIWVVLYRKSLKRVRALLCAAIPSRWAKRWRRW